MKIKAINDKNENTFIDSMMKLYEKKENGLIKKSIKNILIIKTVIVMKIISQILQI